MQCRSFTGGPDCDTHPVPRSRLGLLERLAVTAAHCCFLPQQVREGNGHCGAFSHNRVQIAGGGAWFTSKGFISSEKWNVELCLWVFLCFVLPFKDVGNGWFLPVSQPWNTEREERFEAEWSPPSLILRLDGASNYCLKED